MSYIRSVCSNFVLSHAVQIIKPLLDCAGPLLRHIIEELKSKRENPNSEKLFQFYSGHDGNIVALLDMMGVWKETLPDYSSALFFELRELDSNYVVTVSKK